ncbi:MAG: hypothetical protein NZ954_00470 [Thermofilaceae archaeon]|nr:hypothetical protein [Thermofilaceae archaeon]MCX8180346.1 hypothetical protein [Thermofilaceae archaeon]MDW8003881.1 hypothetical protein [Thermofilaceae archaeon]
MKFGEIAGFLLLAEACVAAALYRRDPERLVEMVLFLVFAGLILTLNIIEYAVMLSSTEPTLFSRELTRRIGYEIRNNANITISTATKWALTLSSMNSILLGLLIIISLSTGGFALIASTLAQAGVRALQALVNAILTCSLVTFFIGQLYTISAKLSDILYLLFPIGGLLVLPRSSRKLGFTFLALCLSISIILPAVLNSTAKLINEWRCPQNVSELGSIELLAFLEVPMFSIEGSDYHFKKMEFIAPPGVFAVYTTQQGENVVRPTGQWFLEYTEGEYVIKGAVYAGLWLPVEQRVFQVQPEVKIKINCSDNYGNHLVPSCIPVLVNVSRISFKLGTVDSILVLFYDDKSRKGPPRRWGSWLGKGFFVMENSQDISSNSQLVKEAYLRSHKVVGVLDPKFCDFTKGEEVISLSSGGETLENFKINYTEVIAWIEGDVSIDELCQNGEPIVLHPGESVVELNGSILRLKPELSCRLEWTTYTLNGARNHLADWFDMFAKVINLSLPPLSSIEGSRRCLYGYKDKIYALTWGNLTFYSQALWPARLVPKITVKAKYFGNISKPAVVGPAVATSDAEKFHEKLTLVYGYVNCKNEIDIIGYTVMNESVTLGLFYDSRLKDIVNGKLTYQLKGIANDIFECFQFITLVAVSIVACSIAFNLLSWMMGGVSIITLLPLKPLKHPTKLYEDLGLALKDLIKTVFHISVFRGSPSRLARGPLLAEAFDLKVRVMREVKAMGEFQRLARAGRLSNFSRFSSRTLSIALKYTGSHPIPSLLGLASDITRKWALSRVDPRLPYDDRILMAFLNPIGRRLIIASDILYALAWILNSKPLTSLAAAPFVKRIWIEYKPSSSGRRAVKSFESLPGVKAKKEFEQNLVKLADDILKGQEIKDKIKVVNISMNKVFIPAKIYNLLEGGLRGSRYEVSWKVAILAIGLRFENPVFFELIRNNPHVAVRIADIVALGKLQLEESWRKAVFEGITKIGYLKPLEINGVGLASVWLHSIDKREPWRYFMWRLAMDAAEGRDSWFTSSLPTELKKWVVKLPHLSLTLGDTSGRPFTVPLHQGVDQDVQISPFESRFLKGFNDSIKRGSRYSLREATEALAFSGDPYWLGYSIAQALQTNEIEKLVETIVNIIVSTEAEKDIGFGSVVHKTRVFLEHAYRELALSTTEIGEYLQRFNLPLPLPEPGQSIAMALEAGVRVSKLESVFEDLLNKLNSELNKLNALVAESTRLMHKTSGLDQVGLNEWKEYIRRFDSTLIKILREYTELKAWVEESLNQLSIRKNS